jgi:hypothetical protein
MLLNQLVTIDETGIVANSVNFDMMEQAEKNQKLCEGFVFNPHSALSRDRLGIRIKRDE